jgi:hypothetical protein
MQDQVVDKIEPKLQEVPALDFVRSYTRSGFANIFVILKGSMRGEAVKDAWYQARKKVGDIRQTFPEGVIGPYFNDEFGDTYISLYAFTGRDFAYPELKAFAKSARHSAAHSRRRESGSPGDTGLTFRMSRAQFPDNFPLGRRVRARGVLRCRRAVRSHSPKPS